MWQKTSTLTANLTTGVLTPSDPICARKTLAITLSGVGSLTVSNVRAALYRRNLNGIDGTLVATCNTFTVSGSDFIGSMSLNTTEVVTAFTDLAAVREYETCKFSILVWDTTDNVYIVWDEIKVAYEFALTSDATAVSPISTGTTTFGNLRNYGGTIYIQNATTGLWNPLTARGVDDQQHMELGDGASI